jgi:hypothetical protein
MEYEANAVERNDFKKRKFLLFFEEEPHGDEMIEVSTIRHTGGQEILQTYLAPA